MPGLTELGRQWNDAVGSADQPWNTLGLSPGMTHEAEQANPVPGIVEGVRKYLQSGDYTPIHELGTRPADYLRELARNPDIMAKNIEQASNFNFGGAIGGKGPPQVVRGYKGAHPYVNEPDLDWRGNVVKSYGEPQELDLSKGASSAGHAGFFSSDPEVANRFAIAESRQPAVFPTDIAFKRPLIIDGEGKPAAAWQFDSVAREHGFQKEQEAVRNALHPNSEYDGVIVRNTKDEGDVYIPKAGSQITSQFARTRNYVVFDDKTINILKKYGLLGLFGGGAASQVSPNAGQQ